MQRKKITGAVWFRAVARSVTAMPNNQSTGIQHRSSELPVYMRRADAASYLNATYGIPCVDTTLAKYACIGGGPPFRKLGKFAMYSRDDLDAWAKQRLGELIYSTSEYVGPKI